MLILHDKQLEILKSKARFKIVRAGRKGGKSVMEVEDMCLVAVSGRNRNVFYIAPTQIQARDIVWEIFKKRLYKIAEFNEQRLEIKVPTKDGDYSLIKLAGWENRENFRGKTAYKLVFDEVDTMQDFFMGWQDIFRPTLLDTGGDATFIGTPKKENPNLRRLEKIAETDKTYATFHFTSFDNPYLSKKELEAIKDEYKDNPIAYRQEILAEHIDSVGSLFKYNSLIDVFSNTIIKKNEKYLICDIADDGSDKTIFSFWEDLEEYRREEYARLNTEGIIAMIREYASQDRIPYSHIAVDAIGVGAGVATNSLLDGIIGYKSSYQAIKIDPNIVRLANVGYVNNPLVPLTSDCRNLRSQSIFTLADLVNNHRIASRITGRQKEVIIEELSNYQDVSAGDGKRQATAKEDIKKILGRSPDASDTWLMRMYFVIAEKMLPNQSEEIAMVQSKQRNQFEINQKRFIENSNK